MTIKIEGFDFVLQVTKAVASDFERRTSDVETTVEFSYGIQGFIAGESDIANASAPMSGEAIATAVDNGVDYLELPVAKSVITIMVNERNDFVECLTSSNWLMSGMISTITGPTDLSTCTPS